jgi:hypothetical protein
MNAYPMASRIALVPFNVAFTLGRSLAISSTSNLPDVSRFRNP